jgi:ribonuclease HI
MEKHFVGFTLCHISRAENAEADKLAKAAAYNAQLPPDVFFQVGFTLCHVPRAENAEADELAKAAAHNAQLPPDVFF